MAQEFSHMKSFSGWAEEGVLPRISAPEAQGEDWGYALGVLLSRLAEKLQKCTNKESNGFTVWVSQTQWDTVYGF